jgi:hypothetical protein
MNVVELVLRALDNRSVNAHLDTPWNLRWHDPEWNAVWERWSAARAAWHRTWPYVDFKYFRDGISWPDPNSMPEGHDRDVATEFVAAKAALHVAWKRYPDIENMDSLMIAWAVGQNTLAGRWVS